jgi:GNAT superfamily N-acetyltransferase
MTVTFRRAEDGDASAILSLRTAVAEDLTRRHGIGHWSAAPSEKSVLRDIRTSQVLAGIDGDTLVGTLCLVTKKPWAIDPSYFTPVRSVLYLVNMAVTPGSQRRGIGRLCLAEAARMAREGAAEAIRLDAYDAAAGAGEFYRRCGYREVGRTSFRGTPLIYFEQLLLERQPA